MGVEFAKIVLSLGFEQDESKSQHPLLLCPICFKRQNQSILDGSALFTNVGTHPFFKAANSQQIQNHHCSRDDPPPSYQS